ncbi:NRPS-like enzyme [Penicillium malachiteum]|uniref:NRPS-like enzyme n=1 Tax=Penicillium malachiteum TaxID=1324776 RepID=UPI002548B30D|nr:NRPS-like enzyme [Penicillium malachiteum]KAJ5715342.1 NRPS-like enzyme [Penicillium malachiteum]
MWPSRDVETSQGDASWNYLRFFPNVKPYVYMHPTADGLHELVILDGLRSKVVSNSDDPPNSFHSRDLFSPHSTIQDAWKYVGRMDDRVTLVNGEKVLPLPIEGRIRDHPLVAEAVVFGAQRDFPGLLVFKGPRAQELKDVEFVDNIWPAVEDANSRAEGFSRISKEAIIPIASGVSYLRTDKGTIIRAKVYLAFEREISTLYESIQGQASGIERPDLPCLTRELLSICRKDFNLDIETVDVDLLNVGMDSLKAAHFSNAIRTRFYIESEEK